MKIALDQSLLKNTNFNTNFCNGSYTYQNNRKERCSLTKIGVLYWNYIPDLFNWDNNLNYLTCPLNSTYQLVRNILSVCVKQNGTISDSDGHVLLIYDERNPSFQNNGKASIAYQFTKASLYNKYLLRKCSWQKIVNYLRKYNCLGWLTNELEKKYGL